MITALALLLYATAAATYAAAWLSTARWVHRSPRLGVIAWQALALNVVLGVALAGLSIAVGLPHLSKDLAALIDACATNFQEAYASPGGVVGSAVGVLGLVAVGTRLTWATGTTLVRDRRARRQAAATTDLLGRRDLLPGVTVLDHPTAYAFCVPGRCSRVVLTTGALALLSDDQLGAVLAHERGHIRGRHHLLLAFPRALTRAFPFVPAFRLAAQETAILVELLADDHARARADVSALGRALSALADTPASQAVLAATSVDVERRISRLTAPLPPLRGATRMLALGVVAAVLALPFAMVAGPAIAVATDGLCLIG